MGRVVIRIIAALAVIVWLAFVLRGLTFGWGGLANGASAFEAWVYTWTTFPVLLAFSAGIGATWGAARLVRTVRARPWIARLGELHEEGVTLRNLGQTMTDPASLPPFVRGVAEWEERTYEALRERARVDAIAFRAPSAMLLPELRARYFSEEHRTTLQTHAERLLRLARVIARGTQAP